MELDAGLEELFHLLRTKFEGDGYEPCISPENPDSITATNFEVEHLPYTSRTPTDLSLTLVDDQIAFDDLTSPGALHGFRRLPLTCSPNIDALYPVVCAATNWYYHLRRRPVDAKRILTGMRAGETKGKVMLDLVKLKGGGGWDDYARVPATSARTSVVNRREDSLVGLDKERGAADEAYSAQTAEAYDRCTFVEVEADGDTIYSQVILNETEYALYPALFYFDNSDFSISESLYHSSSSTCVLHRVLDYILCSFCSEILPPPHI